MRMRVRTHCRPAKPLGDRVADARETFMRDLNREASGRKGRVLPSRWHTFKCVGVSVQLVHAL